MLGSDFDLSVPSLLPVVVIGATNFPRWEDVVLSCFWFQESRVALLGRSDD